MSLTLRGLGMERVALEALKVLHEGVDQELQSIKWQWDPVDTDSATLFGDPTMEPIDLEPIVTWAFGHRKSMIGMPRSSYPAISSMCFQLTPNPLAGDQFFGGTPVLVVEGIVAGDTESACNRRAFRTAEAANNVIVESTTLNGIVADIPMPDASLTNEVDRTSGLDSEGEFGDGSGEVWWWQGFTLTYRLQTTHTVRSRQRVPVPFDGIDVDQLP